MLDTIQSLFSEVFNQLSSIPQIIAVLVAIVLLFYVLGKTAKFFIMPLIKGFIVGAIAVGGLAWFGMPQQQCLVVGVCLFLGTAVIDLLRTAFSSS